MHIQESLKNNTSDLSIQEQLEHYKSLSDKYERSLVDCHEVIVDLMGSRDHNRPSITSVASRISHATKDAVSSYIEKTGYTPNYIETPKKSS